MPRTAALPDSFSARPPAILVCMVDQTIQKRFWAKVDTSGDCWEWRGSTRSSGYGGVRIGGTLRYAHRVSFEMARGQIEPGLLVCHRCDNKKCVRPDHLFVGTHTDNRRDAISKGRGAHGPSHAEAVRRGRLAARLAKTETSP